MQSNRDDCPCDVTRYFPLGGGLRALAGLSVLDEAVQRALHTAANVQTRRRFPPDGFS